MIRGETHSNRKGKVTSLPIF